MKKIFLRSLIAAVLLLTPFLAWSQAVEREKDIYDEMLSLEFELVSSDAQHMFDGDDDNNYVQMAQKVFAPISAKYNISLNQAREIFDRGISRKFSDQEWAIVDKISADLEAYTDKEVRASEHYQRIFDSAKKHGLVKADAYDLIRRMMRQSKDQTLKE